MNNTFRGIMLAAVITLPVSLLPVFESAEAVSESSTEAVRTPDFESEFDPILNPHKVGQGGQIDFDGSQASPHMSFEVAFSYGHVKVEVNNTGSYPITFSVQRGNDSPIASNLSVPANSSRSWYSYNSYPRGIKSGAYIVQFRANGKAPKGSAYAITGQFPSDLQ